MQYRSIGWPAKRIATYDQQFQCFQHFITSNKKTKPNERAVQMLWVNFDCNTCYTFESPCRCLTIFESKEMSIRRLINGWKSRSLKLAVGGGDQSPIITLLFQENSRGGCLNLYTHTSATAFKYVLKMD